MSEHEHVYQHLRYERQEVRTGDGRRTGYRYRDTFFCAGCLEYRYVPAGFGPESPYSTYNTWELIAPAEGT